MSVLVQPPDGNNHPDANTVHVVALCFAVAGRRLSPLDLQSSPANTAFAIFNAPMCRQVRAVSQGDGCRETERKTVQFIDARLDRCRSLIERAGVIQHGFMMDDPAVIPKRYQAHPDCLLSVSLIVQHQ